MPSFFYKERFMTFKLAVTGKSGSGKTTVVKGFLRVFQEYFPEKSILLFDNDLTSELGHSFGIDIRNKFTVSEAENMSTKQAFQKECLNKNMLNGRWKTLLFH